MNNKQCIKVKQYILQKYGNILNIIQYELYNWCAKFSSINGPSDTLDRKRVQQGATLSPACLCPEDGLCKHQENEVKAQRGSVMAQLLRVWREVVAVVPFDVGVDAAALAPPLVVVGGQTRETEGGDVCPHLFHMRASRCDGKGVYLAWMF